MSFAINPDNGMYETGRETGAFSVANKANLRELSRRAPNCNYTATANPGTGNNTTQGYHPGSRWLNTSTGKMWECIAATSSTATWQLEGSGGASLPINESDVTNLVSDLAAKANASALGTIASHNVGEFLQVSNRLSELSAVAATARTNLGLGATNTVTFNGINLGTTTNTSGGIRIIGDGTTNSITIRNFDDNGNWFYVSAYGAVWAQNGFNAADAATVGSGGLILGSNRTVVWSTDDGSIYGTRNVGLVNNGSNGVTITNGGTARTNLYAKDGDFQGNVTLGTNTLTAGAGTFSKTLAVSGTNNLVIGTCHFYRSATSPLTLRLDADGAGGICYLDVTGTISAGAVVATVFQGSGASLTSLAAGQLTGTLNLARFGTQTANTILAGPTSGAGANPTFRAVNTLDLAGVALSATNLTSGTLPLARFGTATANTFLGGPTSGGAATPTIRALVAADIPNLPESKITNLTTDLDNKPNRWAAENGKYVVWGGGGGNSLVSGGFYKTYTTQSDGTVWSAATYDNVTINASTNLMLYVPSNATEGDVLTVRLVPDDNTHTLDFGAGWRFNANAAYDDITAAFAAGNKFTFKAIALGSTQWNVVWWSGAEAPPIAFAILSPVDGSGYDFGGSYSIQWNDGNSHNVDVDAVGIGSGASGTIALPTDVEGSHTVTVNGTSVSYVVSPPVVPGCTNPEASNYNPDANFDDGSCVFPPPTTLSITFPSDGATYTQGDSFNPSWTVDSGSDDATIAIGGGDVASGASGAEAVDTTSLTPGDYTLQIRANNYLSPSDSITIHIQPA